jgi:hypothetical protein
MIAFMRGIRMPVVMVVIPLPARMASNALVYLLSRSRIRYCIAVVPASWRSMMRFRACWVVQPAVGCAVAPRMRTRRVVCSMTARTNSLAPVRVRVSKKSGKDGVCLAAQERGPGLLVATRCWVDAVGSEDFPDGGGSDLDGEAGEFAVDAAVAPAWVLAGRACEKYGK